MSKGSGGGKADVVGAARETGEQARWLAREQTLANRPNQVNPWGSTTWYRTPVTNSSYFTGLPGQGGGGNQGGGTPGGSTGGSGGSTQPNYGAPEYLVPGINWDQDQMQGAYDQIGDAISQLENWDSPYGTPQTKPMFGTSLDAIGDLKDYDFSNLGDFNFDASGMSLSELPMANWTQVETLNPKLQDALDAQFDQIKGRSELASSLLPQLQQDMGTPMDWGQFGDVIGFDPEEQRKLAEDASYQRSVNRLDPRFQEEANALEVNLRNKGLRPGDQAYDSAMANFGRTKNDAYEQARLGATAEGRSETELGMQTNQLANALRTQRMQEELYKRGYTLEQINALMQGQEIEGSTPSMNEKSTIADILNGGNAGLLGGG